MRVDRILCLNGACAGVCVPGATQCNGNQVQICDATGQWQTSETCPGVCSSGQCG